MLQSCPLRLKLTRGTVARPLFHNVTVRGTEDPAYTLPATFPLERATPLTLLPSASGAKSLGVPAVCLRVCLLVCLSGKWAAEKIHKM